MQKTEIALRKIDPTKKKLLSFPSANTKQHHELSKESKERQQIVEYKILKVPYYKQYLQRKS